MFCGCGHEKKIWKISQSCRRKQHAKNAFKIHSTTLYEKFSNLIRDLRRSFSREKKNLFRSHNSHVEWFKVERNDIKAKLPQLSAVYRMHEVKPRVLASD